MDDPTEVLAEFNRELEEELRRIVGEAARGPIPWRDAVRCAGALIEAGGKRLRPRLCAIAHQAAHGGPLDHGVVRFATGIELLHTCMLVQDDVMDRSDVRRGIPAVHRAILDQGVLSDARLAEGIAVVVGDVLATMATEEFVSEELDPALARRAASVVHRAMRETAAGQILDLTWSGRPVEEVSEEDILLAYQLKTAYFAFVAPLRSGAILAGCSDDIARALADFGLGLGTAFQLRDDLIGFLGDQSLTGKCAVDDLREGKKTLVLRFIWERCQLAEREMISELLGTRDPDDEELQQLRSLATSTGAVAAVERRISILSKEAVAALHSVDLVPRWRNHLLLLAAWLERRSA